MANDKTQVLVIGGSLVGLSASLFLSMRGIQNIVIEKHATSSLHPRAMGFTEHTMEFFRAAGLGDIIPQTPPGTRLRRAQVESLAGAFFEESQWTPGQNDPQREEYSPCTGAAIPQDKLEPILRRKAIELGSEIRFAHEFLSLEQDENGVTALVKDKKTDTEVEISAQYLIAADGGKSAIRDSLGIKRSGVGYLNPVRSVLFKCPDADVHLEKGIQQFEIRQPDFQAFLTTYHDSRWVLMFTDDIDRTEAQLNEAIKKSLGKDYPFEIITQGRWDISGLIAEKYSAGRIFIAGDAAHTLPPTRGGFGANTGIDDVYNLAWKLDFVLSGKSNQKLLDTYSDERQPIGWLRHQQTFSRPDYAKFAVNKFESEKLIDDVAMELGQLLRSDAVIGAGPELSAAKNPNEWAGQAGVRAAHAWIKKNAQRISTVDLFTGNFALITKNPAWKKEIEEISGVFNVPIDLIIVGKDVQFSDESQFEKMFGVTSSGASLVRPDGIVAWRTSSANYSLEELMTIFSKVISA